MAEEGEKHTGAFLNRSWQITRLVRPPAEPTTSAAPAEATASSGVSAVSGLAKMSSAHAANEKTVLVEVPGAGAVATDAAMPRTKRGNAKLTILTVVCDWLKA